MALTSMDAYGDLIYSLPDRYPKIQHSTLVLAPIGRWLAFEHPHLPELSSTYPHHKHIPPDIKHHRVPAPGLRFDAPNLLLLIEEIEHDLSQ